jgi:hypothetical protein
METTTKMLIVAAGQLCLSDFLNTQPMGIFAQRVTVLFRGIFQWLSNTIYQLPKGYPTTFSNSRLLSLIP